MESKNNIKEWLSSKQVKSFTKIKGCDLMHYREANVLEFEKRGNAYFYSKKSVAKLKG